MKIIQDFTVNRYIRLNEDNYILELQALDPIPDIRSGQFAEIRIDSSPDVFLRRPFSILDVDYSTQTIQFYVKIVGKGSRQLGRLHTGDPVNLIFPLGNHFTIPEQGNLLIIGGGSGIAPFILLGKELRQKGIPMTFLIGGRRRQDILLTKHFEPYGEVLMTTEDGSMGEKGLVTQHSVFKQDPFDFTHIVACGPEPMMRAVAEIARLKGINCEVSLENMMACGFGVCLCCITETVGGNKCVCTEGPVFNINNLVW